MSSELSNFISIKSLLRDSSEILSALSTRSSQISKIQNILCDNLGTPLSDHLKVVNFTNESLTIYTDSSAWASRLRFNIQNILQITQRKCGLPNIRSIRVRVSIQESETLTKTRKVSLSAKSSQMIQKTAKSINDPTLREALIKLSQHNKAE